MTRKSDGGSFGRHVYGLGVMAIAALCLAWGTFASGQPVPDNLPGRGLLAYAAAIFMLVCGAAILWRRTAARGAAPLLAYDVLIVLVLMNGPVLLAGYASYGIYETLAIQTALAVGALIVFAGSAGVGSARAARLARVGQLAFGVCAVIFGGAHFAYMNFTAPLVPKWLPPSQVFWAYATGVAQIAAGLAFLSGVRARLAAVLLTAMYVLFTLLVHLPMLIAKPGDHFIMTENATNLALIGVAWLIAQSFRPETA